jgi:ABC-type phosphate/phosphonate transport system permease subunit
MAMDVDIGFSLFAAVAAIILLFLSNPTYSFAFFYLVLNAYYDKHKRDIPSGVVFSFVVPAVALIIMLIYGGLFSPYGYAVSLAAL